MNVPEFVQSPASLIVVIVPAAKVPSARLKPATVRVVVLPPPVSVPVALLTAKLLNV